MTIRLVGRVLGSALLLGVLGDWLLRADELGLNFFLGIAALVIVAVALMRWERDTNPFSVRLLFLLSPLFAFGVVWRDAPLLSAWNVLATAATLALPIVRMGGVRLSRGTPSDYIGAGATTAVRTATGPLSFASRAVPWDAALNQLHRRRAATVTVGILLAAPLLLGFGALLVAADAGFERVVRAVFDLDFEKLLTHVARAGFVGWISAGYLIAVLVRGRELAMPWPQAHRPALGTVELAIPLGGLALLFSVFVVTQAEYVFGGHTLIREAADLGYADYARRGFFELVAVAVLVLPVLLLADGVTAARDATARKTVTLLSGGLLLLVGLIMGSAIHRMLLYLDAYGLTQSRVYATGVLLWTGVTIAWFAATVLRGRTDRFAFGAVVGALAVIGTLNAINVDAMVVRTNVARARDGIALDVGYLAELSADGVPSLVAVLPDLPDEAACAMLEAWSPGEESDERGNWRSWNIARARAREQAARLTATRAARCGGVGAPSTNDEASRDARSAVRSRRPRPRLPVIQSSSAPPRSENRPEHRPTEAPAAPRPLR